MISSPKYRPLLYCFSVVFFVLIAVSCTQEPDVNLYSDTLCYDTQVLPVLLSSCGTTGCHDAETAKEGFNVNDFESVMRRVVPGKPRQSKLYTVTTNIWSDEFMPPDAPLTAKERNIIEVWILQGAQNIQCDTTGTHTNGGNNGNGSNPDTICFQQDILPIFASSCGITGCHDPASHQEGYVLTDYSSIMNREEGIVPFSAGQSKIYEAITENEDDDRMPPPPNAPLSSEEIALIRAWINEGALDSDCPDSNCDTLNTISFSEQVFPLLQTNCVSCHSSPNGNAGIFLDNYANIVSAANVEIGGTSVLVGVTRRSEGFQPMPPLFALDDCSVRILELWIEQGKQNN